MSSPDLGRRRALSVLGGASCAAAAAALGAPVVATVLAPASRQTVVGASGFVPTVSLAAVPEDGTPIVATIVVPAPRDAWRVLPPTEVGAVFLRRDGERVLALSTVCPHLGCAVDVVAERKVYRCPCHDSDFALDGAVLTGPSPRGLDALEARVEAGVVEVRYQRFRTATAERIVT